jgi:hypothetical protein
MLVCASLHKAALHAAQGAQQPRMLFTLRSCCCCCLQECQHLPQLEQQHQDLLQNQLRLQHMVPSQHKHQGPVPRVLPSQAPLPGVQGQVGVLREGLHLRPSTAPATKSLALMA